jgi:HPt (histidine-containing phosphotransfer) domain-containing protein
MSLNAKPAAWTLRLLPARHATASADVNDRDISAAGQGPRRYRARISAALVLDRNRLQESTGTLQSWRFHDFVSTFQLMLPHRVEKIHQALAAGDWEDARFAAQSLSWSAAKAGACRLELIADLIDADLRSGRNARARETARLLQGAATELATALARLSAG